MSQFTIISAVSIALALVAVNYIGSGLGDALADGIANMDIGVFGAKETGAKFLDVSNNVIKR